MDFSKYDPNNCCKSTTEYDARAPPSTTCGCASTNDSSNTIKFGLHHGDVSQISEACSPSLQETILIEIYFRAYLVKSPREHVLLS